MKASLNFLFLLFLGLIIISCKNEPKYMVFQPNPEQGKDAVISEAYGERNFAKLDRLHLLSLTINDTIDSDSRFLLRIGFSTLPQNAKVDSAFVYLSAIEPGHFGINNSFSVEMTREVWLNDEINWNNQPKTYKNYSIVVEKTKEKLKNQKIDITSFVKEIVSNEKPNFGFLFKLLNEEKPYKGVRFHSSNSKIAEKRPKLEIFYKQ